MTAALPVYLQSHIGCPEPSRFVTPEQDPGLYTYKASGSQGPQTEAADSLGFLSSFPTLRRVNDQVTSHRAPWSKFMEAFF